MQVVGRVGGRHASLDVCVCTVQGRDGASVVFELVCEMEYRPPAGRELMYQAGKRVLLRKGSEKAQVRTAPKRGEAVGLGLENQTQWRRVSLGQGWGSSDMARCVVRTPQRAARVDCAEPRLREGAGARAVLAWREAGERERRQIS